jgi:outer membrane protein OmpA-like peptidoglycan-associated protein
MRSFRILSLTLAAALCAAPALAQMYPGQDVVVNPRAAGTQVLLYPGGHYVRLVPPLAQPGAPGTGLEPIHLHMPVARRIARVHHATHLATAAASDNPPATEQPAPTVTDGPPPATDAAPPPAPARHRKKESKTETAAAEPAPETGAGTAIPFSFGGPPVAAPAPKAEQKAQPAPKAAAPVKVAAAEPPPAQTQAPDEHPAKDADNGLSKRGEILFKHDATDPAPAQFDGLKLLAGDLTSALQAGATRIQLQAYGGAPGDKGSDARRLSLKRALAIRQVLIDNGVPSTKIDVRAMGGIDDHGNTDRVDVYVRAS